MTAHSPNSVHKELVLEEHLVAQLVSGQGYEQRTPEDYDRASALDRELVLRFVKDTQAEEWAKLEAHYTASAEAEFFKNLEKALKTRSTLDVLRGGIKMIPGIKFALCYFKPASALEPRRVAEYEANILSVIRQVRYSLKSENAIDVALVCERHSGRDAGNQEPSDRLDLQACRKAIPHRPSIGGRAAADLQARRARALCAR